MKKSLFASTIVAVSSPRGESLRSIVRLSGPKAFAETEKIFLPAPGGVPFSHFGAFRGQIHLPHLSPFPVLLFTMPSPHSYTTEDMVELHIPGSPLLCEEILRTFLSHGLALAGPGEFTKRAFLSGRIDLLHAEAVLGLIESSSQKEIAKAQRFLEGKMGKGIEQAVEALKEVLAEIQAFIDFPDYDVEPENDGVFHEKIAKARESLEGGETRRKKGLKDSCSVALWGYSNAGKSSLFNALIGEEKSLVSAVPFTTRDALSVRVKREGKDYLFWDLASLEVPSGELEKLARERSLQHLQEADLVVLVLDGSREILPQEREEMDRLKKLNRPFLVVENKKDLQETKVSPSSMPENISLCALSGEGIEVLWEKIQNFFWKEDEGLEMFFNDRQIQIYEKTRECLDRAMALEISSLDLIAVEVEEALSFLGELTGEVVTDEILDIIFSKFCIGK